MTLRERTNEKVKPFRTYQSLSRYNYWPSEGWSAWETPSSTVSDQICVTERSYMSDNTNKKPYPRVSSLNCWKCKRDWSDGFYQQTSTWVRSRIPARAYPSIALPGDSSIPASDNFGGELYSKTLEKMLAQSEMTPAAMSIPIIKEMRETIEMIRNPMSFLNAFSPRRVKRGDSLGKVLRKNGFAAGSDAWLQFQYGWKPFLSDLVSVGTLLVSLDEKYSEYLAGMNKSRTGSSTCNVMETKVRKPPGNPAGLYSTGTTLHTAGCRAYWEVFPSGDVLSKADYLRTRLGLTNRDLLTAAWEVIPYSFVVDWFIPVGNFLNDITHTPCNFRVNSVMYTHSAEFETKWYFRDGWSPLDPDILKVYDIATDKGRVYIRNSHNPFEGSDSWLTTTRAISAVFLLMQRLRLPMFS